VWFQSGLFAEGFTTIEKPVFDWWIATDRTVRLGVYLSLAASEVLVLSGCACHLLPYGLTPLQPQDCSGTTVLRCGTTTDNAVRVTGLALAEGARYYLCIRIVAATVRLVFVCLFVGGCVSSACDGGVGSLLVDLYCDGCPLFAFADSPCRALVGPACRPRPPRRCRHGMHAVTA
jgi:hypothetical protein